MVFAEGHQARWCSHASSTASLPYQGTSAGSLKVRMRLMLQRREGIKPGMVWLPFVDL